MISTYRHTSFRVALVFTLLYGLSFNAAAETRYVTDVLLLSVYEEINSKGQMLKRLDSGTEVELLETSGYYARIRTEEGVEGWTKAIYLVADKPARAQLQDLQNEKAALEQQLAESQQALDASKKELAKVMDSEGKAYAEMAERLAQAEKTAMMVAELREENDAFRQQLSGNELRIPIKWGLIAAGVTLLLGLIAGIAWFDYRSRKRHGGYRIY